MNIFEQFKHKWKNLNKKQKIILVIIFLTFYIVGNLIEDKPVSNTKVEDSKYNNISPSEYYKEMKSDNMEFADIAWHAKKNLWLELR